MQTERGGFVGPAGKFLRVMPGTLGRGLFKGYALAFDADAPDGDAEWELSQPDANFKAVNVATGEMLGMDATRYSADLCHQVYTTGGDVTERGAYESLLGRRDGPRDDDPVLFLIRHEADGRTFYTAPLVWVKK
jgi:hypothetical protein